MTSECRLTSRISVRRSSARSRSPKAGSEPKSRFERRSLSSRRYFAGRLHRFDLALAPEGTTFQREVWTALTTIPYGETVSYGELARHLGRPAASRAVGAANGRNSIPIVIPCHRVVGADGSLTGFGGGLVIKRRLLELEAGIRQTLPGRSPGDIWKRTDVERSPLPLFS